MSSQTLAQKRDYNPTNIRETFTEYWDDEQTGGIIYTLFKDYSIDIHNSYSGHKAASIGELEQAGTSHPRLAAWIQKYACEAFLSGLAEQH